ncbi:hypothetical protein L6164_014649 [Bauhinia variegata]|uniref:Uncharacterized protein n=1 Tax=Bauhinia variegata TaxID=167791 RepID=A0ACB9NI91_BAUVA|nr:hypothetical protein L6164_014649 [Bauhinia variegata]
MGIASKAGDYAFRAFTAGLGLATIYLTATFSINVYRGLSWHNAQSKLDKQDSDLPEATSGHYTRISTSIELCLVDWLCTGVSGSLQQRHATAY